LCALIHQYSLLYYMGEASVTDDEYDILVIKISW